MTDLEYLVERSYGALDNQFAYHELDRKNALEALMLIIQNDIPFKEYIRLHVDYLTSKECSEDFIVAQITRVKNLELYFTS